MAVMPNCTVSSTRAGTAIYTARAVQIDAVPLKRAPPLPGADALMELGGLNQATLYDTTRPPGGNWQAGDRLTIVSKVGVSTQRVGTTYGVLTSAEMGGGLPHVTATLVTVPVTFPTTLTVKRGTYNSSTTQTSAPAAVGTISAYVTDVSADFKLAGVGVGWMLRLVTDGATAILPGDQLAGLTLVTGPRTAVVQVQHVALHQLAGWTYKVCLLEVRE